MEEEDEERGTVNDEDEDGGTVNEEGAVNEEDEEGGTAKDEDEGAEETVAAGTAKEGVVAGGAPRAAPRGAFLSTAFSSRDLCPMAWHARLTLLSSSSWLRKADRSGPWGSSRDSGSSALPLRPP